MKHLQTFFEWIECLYAQRYTGKIELDFLNGIPRSWSKPGPRETFKVEKFDKQENTRDALTV